MILVIAASRFCSVKVNIMNASTNALNGREVLYRVTKIGFIVATALWVIGQISANAAEAEITSLKPPEKDQIPVAFFISDGAVVIDFCGPWEVFQDVMIPGRQDMPFRLYTVAETRKTIRTSGGMQIVPDYTIQNAPLPKVI